MDPAYECDAPTYIDFALLQQGKLEDDNADEWFDQHIDDEDHLISQEFEDSFVPQPGTTGPTVKTETPVPKTTQVKQEPESSSEDRRITRTVGVSNAHGQAFVKAWREEVKRNSEMEIRRGIKRKEAPDSESVAQHSPKKAREAAKKANESIHLLMKPRTPKAAKASDSVTLPHTPDVLKRYETKKQMQSQAKTTEQLQMEEIQRLQKEAKKKLRRSRKSFHKLAKTSAPAPVKYSKPTTEAVAFNFHTQSRERGRPSAKPAEGINPVKFPMTLRSNKEEILMSVDRVTKVKPFKFHLDQRLNNPKDSSTNKEDGDVPTAEFIQKFHKSTPPRFHSYPTSRPGTSGGIQRSSFNSDATHLTLPKTPNLLTRSRLRPVTAKSATEREEEEVTKMKEYQFKARPLNPDIFRRAGLYGVPQKLEAPLTQPVTPHLTTEERIQQKKEQQTGDQEEEKPHAFHARPMPKDIFEKVKGVPEKRSRALTFPESPAMALKKRRLEAPTEEKEEETDSHIMWANPMPQLDKVFKPQLSHRATEIQPFNFEERYKDKPTRQSIVQQILEKEKKLDFRAQPLPEFGVPLLPSKMTLPPTKPQPFNLQTGIRGQQYTSKWLDQVAEEARKAREEAEFRAREATVLYSKPFVPLNSAKPLTEVGNVVLHSEVRHEQRAAYEAEKQERQLEQEKEENERKALREAEEAKALMKYRRSLVHKAQSIHQYAPIIIEPSEKPLTAPKAPVFLTDSRLRGLATDV